MQENHKTNSQSSNTLKVCDPADICRALASLAAARQAKITNSDLDVYVGRLKYFPLSDLVEVCAHFAEKVRQPGETAFPPLGDLIDALHSRKRLGLQENKNEAYQQQVCPVCAGVVGMMRPIGEQFRTWCLGCQSYRKIVPEDLDLSHAEWSMLCMELGENHRQWRERGAIPSECVDPRFDRNRARGHQD